MQSKSQLAVPPIQRVVYCNISFSPGLTDVAVLGWACHAESHLGHAFHWTEVVLDPERGVI